MTMTDLGEIIASLERNQQERRERDAVLSERIQERLSNAKSLLEAENGNGSHPVPPVDPVYEEIRQSLERVRQIARDLREGRY